MEKYTLSELIQFEKASRIVCMKYESASKNYDGTIINNAEYVKFKKYNDFRLLIISEIEKMLDKEIKND